MLSAKFQPFSSNRQVSHDNIMKWKCFPQNWPFVRGSHQSPIDSFHKDPVMQSFDVSFAVSLNKLLDKQSASELRCHDTYVTVL